MLVEMLKRDMRIVKVTDKYTYTTETQIWRRIDWYVIMEGYCTEYGTFKRGSEDCTVYNTKADADAAIHEVARMWCHDESHCHVASHETVEYVTKKHRKARG